MVEPKSESVPKVMQIAYAAITSLTGVFARNMIR